MKDFASFISFFPFKYSIRILKADALVKDLRLLREDLLKGCVNSDAKRLVDESMSWPNTQDRTKLFRRTENAGEPRF